MALFDLTANTNAKKVPILNVEYPKDVTMKATDGNATFTAVIAKDGRPDKYTYQWYVNGAPVAGATNATYVRNVSGDKGQYTVWCEVANKAGTVRTREATLTVKRLPVLNATYPQNASVYVTDTATFEAKIAETGYPDSYTYQWYKNGVKVAGATKSSYSFYQSTEGTATVYCEVTNDAGTVKTRTATFTANRIYLYNTGDPCSAVHGGWVAARSATSNDDYARGLTLYSDKMVITSRINERDGGCATAWSIDLSKHTKLTVEANTDGGSWFGVTSQIQDFNTHIKASMAISAWISTMDITNIDVGHIAFFVGGDITRATNIYSVWLG